MVEMDLSAEGVRELPLHEDPDEFIIRKLVYPPHPTKPDHSCRVGIRTTDGVPILLDCEHRRGVTEWISLGRCLPEHELALRRFLPRLHSRHVSAGYELLEYRRSTSS